MGLGQSPAFAQRPLAAAENPTRVVVAEEMHFLDTSAGGVLVATAEGRVYTRGRTIVAVSEADYAVGASDRLILVTTGSSDRTVTLPTVFADREVVVKKVDAGTGAVIVVGSGGATIDAQADHRLVLPLNYVRLECDGTNWYVTGAG